MRNPTLFLLLLLLFLALPVRAVPAGEDHEIARVLTVREMLVSREDRDVGIEQAYEVRLVLETGPLAGQEFASLLQSDRMFRIVPRPEQRMIVQVESVDDAIEVNIVQPYRGGH